MDSGSSVASRLRQRKLVQWALAYLAGAWAVLEDPRFHSSLGIAYAGLGRCREAAREGERVTGLLPLSVDALYGIPYLWDLSAIRAMCGDAAGAVAIVKELLTVPSWISPAFLENDFRLDGVRDDPAFQDLVRREGDPSTRVEDT
jgi:hypothetical protein